MSDDTPERLLDWAALCIRRAAQSYTAHDHAIAQAWLDAAQHYLDESAVQGDLRTARERMTALLTGRAA